MKNKIVISIGSLLACIASIAVLIAAVGPPPILRNSMTTNQNVWEKSGSSMTWTGSVSVAGTVSEGTGPTQGSNLVTLNWSTSPTNNFAWNVLWYGADPTGVSDSWSAIQSCVNSNTGAFFPSGTYKITKAITNVTSRFWGQGPALSQIRQYGTNTPIVVVGDNSGSFIGADVGGLRLIYDSNQPDTATDSICLQLNDSIYNSRFHDLSLYGGCYGVKQVKLVGPSAVVFDCQFDNIYIHSFSGIAWNLIPVSGGNSGNCINMLYIISPTGTSSEGVRDNSNNNVYNMLDIEGGFYNRCFFSSGVSALVINSLHLESISPNLSSGSFVLCDASSSIEIHGAILSGCNFQSTNYSGNYYLTRVTSGGSRISISGYSIYNNTLSGVGFRRFSDDGSAENIIELYGEVLGSNNQLDGSLFTSTVPSPLRRLNQTFYGDYFVGLSGFYSGSNPGLFVTNKMTVQGGTTNLMIWGGGVLISNIANYHD